MGVNLRWENENGKEMGAVLDPHMIISKIVLKKNLQNTTCLRFIDPYGNAVFNQIQIPILISEIRDILQSESDPDIRDHLQCVLDLAGKSVGKTHTYLRFIGD